MTKLLDRKEHHRDPKAKEAIRQEGESLVNKGTWLLNTVIEKKGLIAKSKASGQKIHMGDLNPICSIKHFELDSSNHRYRGRITFRGDNTRDEDGAMAIFQELSASPTSIQDANVSIAYGLLPGHRISTADAVKAYIQAMLKSKYPTYVRIPKELWPADGSWEGKYHQPMCLLERALYGHPESGAHWERHFSSIIKDLGGEPVPDHPSLFHFSSTGLLLTVYVDDLLLAGPSSQHDDFWKRLGDRVEIDEVGDLGRFLGRDHVFL